MTVIINITFPGILGVLCPSGMPCLPGFHPSFEDLHELWDLKLVTCIAPPGTSFCRVPPWVRGEPYCTADPQSSNPLHTKVCVYICTPETTALWNSRASFFHCTQLSCPENPSLTQENCCQMLTSLHSSLGGCCCSAFLALLSAGAAGCAERRHSNT